MADQTAKLECARSEEPAGTPGRRSWYRVLSRCVTAVYFDRVTVSHAERIPDRGPVLYLGLHRNGAVDGFVYHTVLPRATFLISTQLTKSWLTRLFFGGIEVVRGKDEGDRSGNARSLDRCLDLLQSGGELFIFPEGTSSLGPRHLPFKSGAAHILASYLERSGSPAVKVVPVGIHYERAWGFRSRVEVVVGEPIATDLEERLAPLGRLKELRRRIQAGLEKVGINVDGVERQEEIERLAFVAALGQEASYFRALKTLESGVPDAVRAAHGMLEAAVGGRAVWRYQGVPILPLGSAGVEVAAVLLAGPVVLAGGLLNLPPLLSGAWAGRRFADDRNVVSLWRILVGMPIGALWAFGVTGAGAATGAWWLAVVYPLLTGGALIGYRTLKQSAVALHNGLRHADVQPRFITLLGELRRCAGRQIG